MDLSIIADRARAGVDRHISFSLLVWSNSNSVPALNTKVSPSSLKQKILSSYAQGDAVNPTGGSR